MWHIQPGSLSEVHMIEGVHNVLPSKRLLNDYVLNMTHRSLCMNNIVGYEQSLKVVDWGKLNHI